jgi:hypothetical protein
MLRRVALVRSYASEERRAAIVKVTRISGLGTTLLVTAKFVPSSPILAALRMEALSSSETSVFQEPHGVTSPKTPFFVCKAIYKLQNQT